MAQFTLGAKTRGGRRNLWIYHSYAHGLFEVHRIKIIIHDNRHDFGLSRCCKVYVLRCQLDVFKTWINILVRHLISRNSCASSESVLYFCETSIRLSFGDVIDHFHTFVLHRVHIADSNQTLVTRCAQITYRCYVFRCVGLCVLCQSSVKRYAGLREVFDKSIQFYVGKDDLCYLSVEFCVGVDDLCDSPVQFCVGIDDLCDSSAQLCFCTDDFCDTPVQRYADIDDICETSVQRYVCIDVFCDTLVQRYVGIDDFCNTSVQCCVGIGNFNDTSVQKCAKSNGTYSHSKVKPSCHGAQRPRRSHHAKIPGLRSRPDIISLLALWMYHALLAITNSNHTAYAAAVSSLPDFSSRPLTNKRYTLVPASVNKIFLYFKPPTILNLRVNTRESVFFNFTLHSQQIRHSTINNITHKNSAKLVKSFLAEKISTSTLGYRNISIGDRSFSTIITTKSTTNSINNNNHVTTSIKSTLLPALSSSNSSFSLFTGNSSGTTSGPTGTNSQTKDYNNQEYWVMVYSNDETIALPVVTSPGLQTLVNTEDNGSYILMAVLAGRPYNFFIEARHIGRVAMSLAVVNMDEDKRLPQSNYVQAVAASEYLVTTIRGERKADIIFNSCAAAIAIIISFGIGAVTDTDSLRKQLKYPVSLVIGFCSEFIIMPVMAFCLAMMFPLDNDIRFGLLCLACVPGGGISHVAVIIADGDIALSLTMNLISVVAMLGTAPLWIFVLGQYFQGDPHSVFNPRIIPIYNFEVWLVATFFAYAAGLAIKRLRPIIADAILMWFIKPFLLLASILYITLGVYINMYVFELVNGYALLGAMLLPLGGCIFGGVLAAICRQNYASIKTIALETSSLNCLVVMVALRFSLKQPDADLAAVIPIWVMFTIPGFFVFLAICNKVKNVLLNFWRNRGSKDSEQHSFSKAYSISSSAVSPPGTTTLSAPLVTADGDDDATISSTSNQKVTVL